MTNPFFPNLNFAIAFCFKRQFIHTHFLYCCTLFFTQNHFLFLYLADAHAYAHARACTMRKAHAQRNATNASEKMNKNKAKMKKKNQKFIRSGL